MSFYRAPQAHVIAASKGKPSVHTFIGEREIDAVLRAADPFGIEDQCEPSPNGRHYAIGSCGDVVCCYCARIFWR